MSQSNLSENLWVKPFKARDPHEKHRVATSLELLFDLIFVVAIATAGQQLHHAIVQNHLFESLPLYFMVFFALWWAWMNFSWFASAYDNDDVLYRILTFVQIIGSLVIAAGISNAFQHQNFDVIIIGYTIMRLSLVTQWFRVAKNDLERRQTALRYAFGIIAVQIGWLLFHFSPIQFTVYIFILLAIAELSVPIFAESVSQTPWHAHHIAERYALLTIIVLGESIVGCSIAITDALSNQRFSTELIFLMIGGLIMMFSMWWVYFDRGIADRLNNRKTAFVWGYGHLFIFISIAAIGAGLAAAVEVVAHEALISSIRESYFVAVCLIVYSTSLYLLYEVHHQEGWRKFVYPVTVIIVLSIPQMIEPAGYAIFAMAIIYMLRIIFSKQFLVKKQEKVKH